MGTRFLATVEAPATPNHKRAIVEAGPEATLRSDRFDLLWEDEPWPGVSARVVRNRFAEFVVSADDELFSGSRNALRVEMAQAVAVDDADRRPLLAGMGSSRIDSVLSLAAVFEQVVGDANASGGVA